MVPEVLFPQPPLQTPARRPLTGRLDNVLTLRHAGPRNRPTGPDTTTPRLWSHRREMSPPPSRTASRPVPGLSATKQCALDHNKPSRGRAARPFPAAPADTTPGSFRDPGRDTSDARRLLPVFPHRSARAPAG